MGGVPWSAEIQLLRDKIELWEMLVCRKKKVKISVKRIRCFLKKVSIRDAFTCSLKEVGRVFFGKELEGHRRGIWKTIGYFIGVG
jgi:hypothetical protein